MTAVFRDLSHIPSEFLGCCVAIGNFDGVHLGHARLIRLLVDLAHKLQSRSLVLTFDPPPIALLKPHVPMQLPITPIDLRAELLGNLGADALVAIPTTMDLLNLTPQHFFEQVLIGQLDVKGIVEGPNFQFGRDRSGNVQLLSELCKHNRVLLRIAEAENDTGGMVSSSRIRSLLSAGKVEQANAVLTRPFRLEGTVSTGAGRGKQVLVPTANLTDVRSLIPGHGVYGGLVHIDDQPFRAAVNIGPNPTFNESLSKIELHLIDWSGDLYGRKLSCHLLTRVRETRKFNSKDELLKQIHADIAIIIERVDIFGT